MAALVELADIGAENAQTYGAPQSRMRSMSFAAGGGEDTTAAPLDLEPQRQTVYAQVNARFTMAPPRL